MSDNLDIWGEVYFAVGRAIESVTSDRDQQATIMAIISGATGAARGVADTYAETFPELEHPAFDRAVAVTEVFAMAMASRWVWHGRDQHPKIDWDAQWAAIVPAVLTLFGTYSTERYRDAWAINRQFRYVRDQEVEGRGSGFAWMPDLEILLTLALAAARASDQPRVSDVPIPVAGSRELWKAGWPSLPRAWYSDLEHATEAHASLLAAEAGMASAYRALREDRSSDAERER